MTQHTLVGLDDRDLALVASACAHRAQFLTHLAIGHHADDAAPEAGYQHDRSLAAGDADRLQDIADALDHR